jgi:hypothetical protein
MLLQRRYASDLLDGGVAQCDGRHQNAVPRDLSVSPRDRFSEKDHAQIKS